MVRSSKLLLDEAPLQIIPSLATSIGLNEAIVLQQIQYWLINRKDEPKAQRDGYTWVYNSYPEWQKQFPWWSVDTIKRTITSLEKAGYLISSNFNAAKMDKTKWYRIEYERLAQRETEGVCPDDEGNLPRRGGQDAPTNTIDYQQEIKSSLRSDTATDQNKAMMPSKPAPSTTGGTPGPDDAPHATQNAPESANQAQTPGAPSKPSLADYRAVLDHIRTVQHIEKEWTNYPAQMRAVKQLFQAGYSVEELTVMAEVMVKDTFWKEKGFSAINMASQAHRYAKKVDAELDEPPMNAFEIKEMERRRLYAWAKEIDEANGHV